MAPTPPTAPPTIAHAWTHLMRVMRFGGTTRVKHAQAATRALHRRYRRGR